MPKPRKGESRPKFLSRCIPQVIGEGKPQKQAIAMCMSMFKEVSLEDKAKFKRYTYNGVSTQSTSRRSSTRDDKAWMRTVRHNGSERLVHYADPNMPMRRNNPDARKNFLARHNCAGKKNPFAPGFWSCYDWSNPSEKEVSDVSAMQQVGVELTLEGKEEFIDGLEQVEQKATNVLDKVVELDSKLKSMHGDEKDDYEDDMPMAMSFDELESMEQAAIQVGMVRDLTNQFGMLAKNIMYSDVEDKEAALLELANQYTARVSEAMATKERWQPLTDYAANFIADIRKAEKPMKTEGGIKYPAADYAYVPDGEKPSTWKLRMTEGRPGNVTVAQLGRAAAAFSPGGFQGNKVQLPQDKVAGVKAKIRGAYEKLGVKPEDMPASIKKEIDQTSIAVWKEKDGTYKFLTVYSNNFRDNDNPPEIIAEKSHKRFDALLENKEIPYPDLWLWHVPEWKIGKVKSHAWDDSGFAVAMGEIDNKEVAEFLIEQGDSMKVSHGMPTSSIKRDEKDNTVIVEHITREISPLPAWAAANKLTGFVVLKEVQEMSIPQDKREALETMGLSASVLRALEESNARVAQEAKESGLESKEVETSEVETANESPTEEALEGGEDETPEVEPKEVEHIDRKEIADAIIAAVQPQQETLKELNQGLVDLAQIVKSLKEELEDLKKSDSEKVAEKAAGTPAASLIDMLKGQSVVGNPDAKVDGRTSLAKASPTITESDEKAKRNASPIPFINAIMNAQKGEEVKLL